MFLLRLCGGKLLVAVRDVVVNFDLGERFPRPRSQQRGSLRPRARRVAVLRVGTPPEFFLKIFDAKSRVLGGGQFWPENKLIEGQPNEYDVICRNASVLAFHLWPTIFAGTAFNRVPAPLLSLHPWSRSLESDDTVRINDTDHDTAM